MSLVKICQNMSKSPVLEISLVFHVSPGRAKWTSASSGPALARPWRSTDPTHHSGAGLFLAEPLSLASASYGQSSDCENPRFTERTSTNLGRSHRLPHVCTIMIYGKLGGYRLQETAAYIYIYMLWTMNHMWYLGIANVDIREIWWHNLEKGYR